VDILDKKYKKTAFSGFIFWFFRLGGSNGGDFAFAVISTIGGYFFQQSREVFGKKGHTIHYSVALTIVKSQNQFNTDNH
jgi:hypothetical protein